MTKFKMHGPSATLQPLSLVHKTFDLIIVNDFRIQFKKLHSFFKIFDARGFAITKLWFYIN